MHLLHLFLAVHKAVFLLLFSTLSFLPLFTTFTFTSAYCAPSCFFSSLCLVLSIYSIFFSFIALVLFPLSISALQFSSFVFHLSCHHLSATLDVFHFSSFYSSLSLHSPRWQHFLLASCLISRSRFPSSVICGVKCLYAAFSFYFKMQGMLRGVVSSITVILIIATSGTTFTIITSLNWK